MKYYVGVDIGSKGSVCILTDEQKEPILLKPFPLISGKPNIVGFAEMLCTYPFENMHVLIEDLHSIFGVSAKSNFAFGWINGATEAVLLTLGISYSKVQARKWQAELFEGVRLVEIPVKGKTKKDGSQKYKIDTKATALLAIQRLYPGQDLRISERAKVPNDGIVDALCIATFCKRHF